MKNAYLIVTLPLLLAACAQTPLQPATAQEPAAEPVAAAAVAAEKPRATAPNPMRKVSTKPAAPIAEDPLPSVALTDDIVFKLLTAEIAFQRGEWQAAYVTILSLAQQTRDQRLAHRAVEIALSAKQPAETLAAIRLWRNLAPNSEEATQYLVGFVLLSDNPAEAEPIFEQRLKDVSQPSRTLLLFQIQRLLARAKDKGAAFAMLERLIKPYQDIPETHLVLAQGAFANGDTARAKLEVLAARAAQPDSELAVLTAAQVGTDKNEVNQLLQDFLAGHPKAREVRNAYARLLVDQKQYDQARAQFEILLKNQPQDLTSLYALGILATQTNDVKAAEKYLTAYLAQLAIQPDEERDPSQARLVLAQIAEDRKDNDAALKWLAQIERGEAYLPAQIKRAQLLAKSGDLTGARKVLSGLEPDNAQQEAQVIGAEAQLLRDANQLQDALAVLDAGIKRFPNNTDLLYDYAMVAEKIHKLDVMETVLRKMMALAPTNQHAYNALGYSLAERNIRLPEALTLVSKALELAPEDPFIMDSMGWVHFRLGDLKEAETFLRRAYKLSADPEIGVHLGEVLWLEGQKEDAQKLWRDAKAKDPQNDTLKNTLLRLQVRL